MWNLPCWLFPIVVASEDVQRTQATPLLLLHHRRPSGYHRGQTGHHSPHTPAHVVHPARFYREALIPSILWRPECNDAVIGVVCVHWALVTCVAVFVLERECVDLKSAQLRKPGETYQCSSDPCSVQMLFSILWACGTRVQVKLDDH